MKYCKKCLMPDTRPGIVFDSEDVCAACRAQERKEKIDWDKRLRELKELCDKYRGTNGDSHDCIIAASGGKDSHFQTYVIKELMGMNPLLVTVEDNFTMTEAGKHNIRNISEEFGCEIVSLKPNIKVQKRLSRKTFEQQGRPAWYIDRLIYTFPIHTAIKFKIPLVIYGENINYEYGGHQIQETYSAKSQINNNVAMVESWDDLLDSEISMRDLSLCVYPSAEELLAAKLEPIYLSYFTKWNSYKNYLFAKSRGFKDLTHEWERTHHVENFDQIDTVGYILQSWMKYPKFGHASATDYASKFIRYGLISRQQGIELVRQHDHRLDQKVINDFVGFCGYSLSEFWGIVDKFYNPELFFKDKNNEWRLRNPIYAKQTEETVIVR